MAFIYTSKTGIGINTGYTGVQSSDAGGGGSPILLPGLIGGQWIVDTEGGVAEGYFVSLGGGEYAIDTEAGSGLPITVTDGQVFITV